MIKHGKVDIAPVAITPPVHEIRFQPNPYTQNATAATPSMPPVLSYASAPSFSAPMESAGTIYHTGVSCVMQFLLQMLIINFHDNFKNDRVEDFISFSSLFLSNFLLLLLYIFYCLYLPAWWHIVRFVTTCDVFIYYVHGTLNEIKRGCDVSSSLIKKKYIFPFVILT